MIRRPPRSTLFPHDALPIWLDAVAHRGAEPLLQARRLLARAGRRSAHPEQRRRSEEHTSELQSRRDLVCRLLLEKKNKLMLHPRTATLHLLQNISRRNTTQP